MTILQTALQALTMAELIAAAVGGFFVGFVLIAEAIRDFGLPVAASTYARMVVTVAIFGIGVFYVGQVVASLLDGDSGWPRIAGRYVDFLVFALTAGLGVRVALRDSHR